tara:strand:- start:239 stop:1489 length:1251 start_codon:yes stop_codon:yes gene_type:complete
MSEQVKVFKNVNNQTATGAAHDVTLVTTTASQQAVIKDINIPGAEIATLDLDGFSVMKSTEAAPNLTASGSLIMGPSSTLKVKFPVTRAPQPVLFRGVFMSNGNDTFNYMEGTGVPASTGTNTALTSCVNRSTAQNLPTNDLIVTVDSAGTPTWWRFSQQYLYQYNYNSATSTTPSGVNWTSNGYGLCSDGTYIYTLDAGGNTTLYRYHIATGVFDTQTTNGTMYGRQENQGSGMEYHNGLIFSKQEGSSSNCYVLNLTTLNVSTWANTSVGSYSDGFGITTNAAGKTYVVEQGPTSWWWYNVTDGRSATGSTVSGYENATQISNGSSASTEYGDGMVEVAPGVLYCFQEQADDLAIYDFNVTPPVRTEISTASSRNASVNDSFGNSFGVAGYFQPFKDVVRYDAMVSGVLITDGA